LRAQKNVAEIKHHKGRIARLVFFVAQNARTGHFAVTVCYVLVKGFSILFSFNRSFNKAHDDELTPHQPTKN